MNWPNIMLEALFEFNNIYNCKGEIMICYLTPSVFWHLFAGIPWFLLSVCSLKYKSVIIVTKFVICFSTDILLLFCRLWLQLFCLVTQSPFEFGFLLQYRRRKADPEIGKESKIWSSTINFLQNSSSIIWSENYTFSLSFFLYRESSKIIIYIYTGREFRVNLLFYIIYEAFLP